MRAAPSRADTACAAPGTEREHPEAAVRTVSRTALRRATWAGNYFTGTLAAIADATTSPWSVACDRQAKTSTATLLRIVNAR